MNHAHTLRIHGCLRYKVEDAEPRCEAPRVHVLAFGKEPCMHNTQAVSGTRMPRRPHAPRKAEIKKLYKLAGMSHPGLL